jgi:predicted dinucleotide-binding enzyme
VVNKPRIGIIGAGRLGTALARGSIKAGYNVAIANSREPESLNLTLRVLIPEAKATTIADLIDRSDIIILAIPLNQHKTLEPGAFTDKIVIDAMNYWPPTEGKVEGFTDPEVGSSERIQQYLNNAKVVKTLNHVAYNELEEQALPTTSPTKRAIAIAGDDEDAKAKVADLIRAIGFDPVDIGGLSNGRFIQPDTELFNTRYSVDDPRVVKYVH